MNAVTGPAARHDARTPASGRQVAYLRALLADVGVVDPGSDPAWPATCSRLLGREHDGRLEDLSKADATRLIDAAKEYLARESAKVERLPAAFVDRDNDPWHVDPVVDVPPPVIRFRGHTYRRVDA